MKICLKWLLRQIKWLWVDSKEAKISCPDRLGHINQVHYFTTYNSWCRIDTYIPSNFNLTEVQKVTRLII